MINIAIIFVLMTNLLTFFVSCSPREQSPNHSQIISPDNSPSTPTGPTSQGTADSGGGNTFMGKPLESYKINPRTLEAYENYIKPWLESPSIKDTRVGHAFASILDNKIWYMIPSEFKQLSPEKIGAAVSSDLQQTALQDFKQVWINSLIYKKMTPADQAILITHELLMGLRLLKFDSALVDCLAFRSTDEAKDPQYCYNNSSKEVRGKPSDLTQNDYAQIRSATALIADRGQKLTLKELEEILGALGLINISVTKTISLNQLSQNLEASKLMKTWPTFGFDFGKFISENQYKLNKSEKSESTITLKSDLACDIDILITDETISVSFYESGTLVTFGSKWTSPIEMNLTSDPLAGFSLYSANFSMLKSSTTVTKGDSVVNVTLKFLGDGLLMGIDLTKTTCLNDDCSQAGQGINGYNVLCYTRQSVTFSIGK